jgi:hypothetical protein
MCVSVESSKEISKSLSVCVCVCEGGGQSTVSLLTKETSLKINTLKNNDRKCHKNQKRMSGSTGYEVVFISFSVFLINHTYL